LFVENPPIEAIIARIYAQRRSSGALTAVRGFAASVDKSQ